MEGDNQSLGKVRMGETIMSAVQKEQMDKLLCEYGERVTTTLGKNVLAVHTINTGDHQPIRSHPNRIAPIWKTQLKEQIFDLVEIGFLVSSQSPWSSAMVPVRNSMDLSFCAENVMG